MRDGADDGRKGVVMEQDNITQAEYMGDGITHALSIKEQADVALMMARAKTIEYRSRKLIARPPETIAIATSNNKRNVYLPTGHIVGIARISAIVPWRDDEVSFFERACMMDAWDAMQAGEFDGMGGGYAMMISGFAACKPAPIKGKVGIYAAPDGFAPVYANSHEQLHEWWHECEAWSDGYDHNDVERELLAAMLEHGKGWRIDD